CGKRLGERTRPVLVDLLLDRRRLLLQIRGGRALRRDHDEVAEQEDDEERTGDDRALGSRREACETGGHEAPLPLRMSETIVKLMTRWLPITVAVLLWSWTFWRSGTTWRRARSRATP